MNEKKKNFYAYIVHRASGITDNWPKCKQIVSGVSRAKFKGFKTREEAEKWLSGKKNYEAEHNKTKITIHFDGACEPMNPGGTASYGWIIKKDKEVLAKDGKIIGRGAGMTNNVAEYIGLIEAIKAMRGLAIKNEKIKIFGDSVIVCNMVAKKWGWNKKKTEWIPHKDAPHLKILLDEALSLLNNYSSEIKWISREGNFEADELSKQPLIKAGIIKPESELGKCPHCTGKLLERKGPRGTFLGCSNYPKCRFTKNLAK